MHSFSGDQYGCHQQETKHDMVSVGLYLNWFSLVWSGLVLHIVDTWHFTIFILIEFPIHVNRTGMELPILYFKGSQAGIFSKL